MTSRARRPRSRAATPRRPESRSRRSSIGASDAAAGLGGLGVSKAHVAEHDGARRLRAAGVGARDRAGWSRGSGPAAVVAPGSERATEAMAHAAAITDLPLAANCIAATPGDAAAVTRVRWGGSLLEEARLHGATKLLTVAAHAVEAQDAAAPATTAVETFAPTWPRPTSPRASSSAPTDTGGGVSLADAKVVVSGGRGAGSTEGFAAIEELAGLLGGAVGCSRAVTIAGWRPHTDQVGQTGTKIAPEIYIPCGISGATQHMAGCKGAKRILAINTDPDAPMIANADYAVIGDLHEVVPAIVAEIRKARGG